MAQTLIKTQPRQSDFSHIFVIGAWGFAIVIASMLFLYVGHLIDEMLQHPADVHAGAVLPVAGALHRPALQGSLGPDPEEEKGLKRKGSRGQVKGTGNDEKDQID